MKDFGEVVVDRKARLDVCFSLRENQKDIRIGFDTDYALRWQPYVALTMS